jgi:hypothetical protein
MQSHTLPCCEAWRVDPLPSAQMQDKKLGLSDADSRLKERIGKPYGTISRIKSRDPRGLWYHVG